MRSDAGVEGGACVAFGGSLFMYGGQTSRGEMSSELLRFDLSECTWQRVATVTSSAASTAPLARAFAGACCLDGKLIVHGGQTAAGCTCTTCSPSTSVSYPSGHRSGG